MHTHTLYTHSKTKGANGLLSVLLRTCEANVSIAQYYLLVNVF